MRALCLDSDVYNQRLIYEKAISLVSQERLMELLL